jgi:photosystem II stability/assembly factor-like uncharacterized protein
MTGHVSRAPLSLDPLIAEARRRTRQRRFVAALALVLAMVAAGTWLALRSAGTPATTGGASSGTLLRRMNGVGATGGVAWTIDGHNVFWLTRDGGRTWQYTFRRDIEHGPTGPGTVADIGQVQFVDSRHGWISAQIDGDPKTFPSDTHPWAIERTVDGGQTWQRSRPNCVCGGGQISFYDARHGYVLADDRWGRAAPSLYRTSDGGASWSLVGHLPRRLNGPITFFNRLDGIVGKYPDGRSEALCVPGCRPSPGHPGALYRTTDGGKTWSKLGTPPPAMGLRFPMSAFGRRLVMLDGNDLDHRTVYASSDGGAHWTASTPPRPAQSRDAVFAAGSPLMWAFATPKGLVVTRDGGRHWEQIVPHGLPRGRYADDLVFSSPLVGWILLGRERALYRTTDGGRHWTPNACGRRHLAC